MFGDNIDNFDDDLFDDDDCDFGDCLVCFDECVPLCLNCGHCFECCCCTVFE